MEAQSVPTQVFYDLESLKKNTNPALLWDSPTLTDEGNWECKSISHAVDGVGVNVTLILPHSAPVGVVLTVTRRFNASKRRWRIAGKDAQYYPRHSFLETSQRLSGAPVEDLNALAHFVEWSERPDARALEIWQEAALARYRARELAASLVADKEAHRVNSLIESRLTKTLATRSLKEAKTLLRVARATLSALHTKNVRQIKVSPPETFDPRQPNAYYTALAWWYGMLLKY